MKTLLSFALSALIAGLAQAQTDYPNRPPRFIVPFPPGGSVDIVTRIVAAKWGELLGQPIVVENRAGAGGNVGADYAAAASPRTA
jgi:tripartite-type tricarboxylate transporter receptor subunit TctC